MFASRFRALLPVVVGLVAIAGCGDTKSSSPVTTTAAQSAAVQPAQQDAGHLRFNQLAGDWTGEKSTYIAGGTPDKPITASGLSSRWHWITKTGNHFLEEEAEGTLGGKPYYRFGLLGYSPTDNRYEWSTVDSVTPMTMTYKGAKNSGDAAEIAMSGEFTDPGILGPQFLGKTIPMRTLLKLESADRTVLEIYFTPPGQPESIADRVILTRKK
jgi:hypothetical protein